MKVYVLPADEYGCGHYRMAWPADVCRRAGMDLVIIPPRRDEGFGAVLRTNPDGSRQLIKLQVPQDMDVMVVQRPAHQYQPQMIKMLRANGIAVVVDMDDDMSNIHRNNVAYNTYNPRSATDFSWKYAMESCREATYVTTSTSTLQRVYAKPGFGVAIDNYIPATYLTYSKPVTGTFGWAGTVKSHPDDLPACGQAVQRLIDDGHAFKVVGAPRGVREQLRLKEEPASTGTVPIIEWVKTIGENLDVGMVPLSPSAFNSAKSRLKGIEYMAVGVPWVASPRTEYRRLQKESGCGLLADGGRGWYTSLQRLLTDEEFRKEQAEAGREYMKSQTYEANAWRWAEAWETAFKIQRGLA